MKKNNKGFTLIEVLSVIVLMSIIGVIAVPNLFKINQNTNERLNRSTRLIIENAAKIYVTNYKEDVDEEIKKSTNPKGYCIPVGKLKAYDYLNLSKTDLNKINSTTDTNTFNKTCVWVKKETTSNGSKYTYEYTDDLTPETDFIPPVLYVDDKDSVKCDIEMEVPSIDYFNEHCVVKASDNVDYLTTVEASNTSWYETNVAYLTYDHTDNAGNKAKTLKVKLILQI